MKENGKLKEEEVSLEQLGKASHKSKLEGYV